MPFGTFSPPKNVLANGKFHKVDVQHIKTHVLKHIRCSSKDCDVQRYHDRLRFRNGLRFKVGRDSQHPLAHGKAQEPNSNKHLDKTIQDIRSKATAA